MQFIYPSKNEIMEFFRKRSGYISVIDIATAMVAPHVQRSTPMDEEWQHILGFLHELKSGGYLLVEGEGKDIYHEKFSSTPDRVKKYFSKDELQDYSDLSKTTVDELKEIVRNNGNAHIADSLHNRALTELEMRHKEKIEGLLQVRQAESKPRGKTVKKDFETPEIFIQSRYQENHEDGHIIMGNKDGTGEKAHVFVDGKDGSLRLEDGRQEPTEIAPHIEVIITLPDGRKIRSTRELMEEANGSPKVLVIEIEKPIFGSGSRTADGLADNITVTVPILIKNFSSGKITLRNARTNLDVPNGYNCSQFHTSIANHEDITGKDFVSRTAQFHASITGRDGGVGFQNPAWNAAKDKIISELSSAKFIFRIQADSVSLEGVSNIEQSFDITEDILPNLKTI